MRSHTMETKSPTATAVTATPKSTAATPPTLTVQALRL